MTDEHKDTADYEGSEEIAISAGKKALSRAPWLFNRRNDSTKGFFVELRDNPINPDYCDAFCVDGNGTKLFLSAWSKDYRKGPIDGVAMNANDLATIINAYPDSINIYLACQTKTEELYMGDIMNGFVDALEMIRIPDAPFDLNIGKIETASLDEMISLGVPNIGVDYGVVMTGMIEKNKIPNLNPKPHHIIVGVSSTGLHSNGFTGARHVLLAQNSDIEYREEWQSQYKGKFKLDDKPDVLEGQTVLEAMQEPTALYLVEAALVGQKFDDREIYAVNITGNGLHNFNRVGKEVAFHITDPMPALPIHKLLMEVSGWDAITAYTKQNMGMGFAYIVPNTEIAEGIVDLINKRGQNKAQIVGEIFSNNCKDLKTVLHKPYGSDKKIEFVGYTN